MRRIPARLLMLLCFAAIIQALLLEGCDWPWDEQTTTPTPTVTSVPLPLSATEVIPRFANVKPGPVVTQTIEDVTVSVQPLSADANRVVILVNTVSPSRPYRNAVSLGWNGDANASLPVLSSGGVSLQNIQSWTGGKVFESNEPVRDEQVLYFNASNMATSGSPISTTVPLSLSLPVYLNNDPPPLLPNATTVPVVGTPLPTPLPSHLLSFTFQLLAPFSSDRVLVPVGQTVENSDVEFTLDRVDVTASETRLYLHFKPVNPQAPMYEFNWATSAELRSESDSKPEDINLQPGLDGDASCNNDSICVFSYSSSSLLRTTPTSYRLTVSVWPPTAPCCGGEMKPLGTWVFHFTVPALVGRK
jgi:hypothetical protein